MCKGGEEQAVPRKEGADLVFLGNHEYLCFSAGGHVHLGAHVPDGPHRLLDGLHLSLLGREVPLLFKLRPGSDHNGLLLRAKGAVDFLRNKRHKRMKKL